jgi:hypothetical protein
MRRVYAMRTLLRARLDTEAASAAIQNGRVEAILGELMSKAKPEAAYFFDDQGKRCASIVFDLRDSSEIPGLVEPLFQELKAEVQLIPVMNLDDLQKGLSVLGK